MADSRTADTAESNLSRKPLRRSTRILVSVLDESRYEIACLVSVRTEPLSKMTLIESAFTKYWELFFQGQLQFLLCKAHDVFALFLSNRADTVHNCSIFLCDVRSCG